MMRSATRCNDCGTYLRPEIQFDKAGHPFWMCSECGVVHEDWSWFKYVSHDEAMSIIETREPLGLFVEDTGIEIVGIDNRDGDAWTEEFPDLTECLFWLADEEREVDR